MKSDNNSKKSDTGRTKQSSPLRRKQKTPHHKPPDRAGPSFVGTAITPVIAIVLLFVFINALTIVFEDISNREPPIELTNSDPLSTNTSQEVITLFINSHDNESFINIVGNESLHIQGFVELRDEVYSVRILKNSTDVEFYVNAGLVPFDAFEENHNTTGIQQLIQKDVEVQK